jgi:hypothetical protein
MTELTLEALRAELAPMREQLDRLPAIETRLAAFDERTAAVERKIESWPDVHFLQAAALRQIEETRALRDSQRHIETKLDEIYGSMVTSPEITRLREEVVASRNRDQELDLRIATIEGHLGLKNPLATE